MFALKATLVMVLLVATKLVSFYKSILFFGIEHFHSITINLIVAAPIEIGCSSDDECASSQACRNRACVNPCAFDDPCSSTAQCNVENHKATCRCPPGMTGDPYSLCVPSKLDFQKKFGC